MDDGEGLRLVVADNDVEALELVVTDLSLEGHEVVARCLDGPSALARCLAELPDVAVLDHRMGAGPHGLEVAQRLAIEAPGIRVVLYTNYEDVELVRGARECGAVYLQKGDLRRLRRAVRGAEAPG